MYSAARDRHRRRARLVDRAGSRSRAAARARAQARVTRVAWNGTRPIVSEATRALDAAASTIRSSARASSSPRAKARSQLMTPRAFDDGEHAFVARARGRGEHDRRGVRALLTSAALRGGPRSRAARVGATGRVGAAADARRRSDGAGRVRRVSLRRRRRARGAGDAASIAGDVVGRLDRGRVARPARSRRLRASRRRRTCGSRRGRSDHDAAASTTASSSRARSARWSTRASDRIVIAAARARERKRGARDRPRVCGRRARRRAGDAARGRQRACRNRRRSIGMRDEIDGQPRWRSIEAPWLRGRGVLRARRRPA